jgi:hypothetical protein
MTSYCYNVYDSPFSIPTMFPMWSILNSYWATKGVSTYRCTIQLLLYSQSKQSWRYILFSFWSEVASSILSSSFVSTRVHRLVWSSHAAMAAPKRQTVYMQLRDQQFSNTPKASIYNLNLWRISTCLSCTPSLIYKYTRCHRNNKLVAYARLISD